MREAESGRRRRALSFTVREGSVDVAVVAGSRVENWPSAGVRSLSTLCAEMGLSVGQYGGEGLVTRGVIPLPGTGGLIIVEDGQGRVHRISARAVVKIVAPNELPDPFPGWRSQGLIPLATAYRLRRENGAYWRPTVVILGTGNRALRFGSELLREGTPEVICVESRAQWGAKRFAGWEVERRALEGAGGRIIEAKPIRLSTKGALEWELRLEDMKGIRVIEVARVVSAGPFRETAGFREFPAGSFLYELEQTAGLGLEADFEGESLEEERGRWLAAKIVKALATDLGFRRDDLDRSYRRAKLRLKRFPRHREFPFTPAYQGKWLSTSDSRSLKAFSGVPQQEHKKRPIASVECIEPIACDICARVCPEDAIRTGGLREQILTESKCTACGICVSACPTGSIALLHEREDRSFSQVTLPWAGRRVWAKGELVTLQNRRGDSLGSGRVTAVPHPRLLQIDVPNHLLWEARGIREPRTGPIGQSEFHLDLLDEDSRLPRDAAIILDGEKRLVPDRATLSTGFFEIGQGRPEDVLFCPDGSCGLCQVFVDGVKRLACRTKIHSGMAIRLSPDDAKGVQTELPLGDAEPPLCPCLGVTRTQIIERIRQGTLRSPEAVLSITHVGEGKCHGQLCMGSFLRLLEDEGLDVSRWADWRFPWSDWALPSSE